MCDVLALRALENLGKWIIRHDRSRPKQWRGKPLYTAHTNWRPDSAMVTKSLRGAWDVVPTLVSRWAPDVDEERLMNALDLYVHGLAMNAVEHDLSLLAEVLAPLTRHQSDHLSAKAI